MIVFDASTLILVAKIELLDSLLEAKLVAAIPPQVERECCSAKKTLDALMISRAIHQSRIKVTPLKNKALVAKLQADFNLGSGEAEAIALALKEKADLVAIDDKNGINACKIVGVPFVTALSILVRSRQKGLVSHEIALTKLVALALHGRYSKAIVDDARNRLEAIR